MGNSTPTMAAVNDAKDTVQKAIDSAKVVVFSKSYCPFCKKVKALFKEKGVDFTALELDQRDDGAAIQAALKNRTGQSTVPNVFVNQKHLGGCDDTMAADKKGDLAKMLAA